MYAVIYWSSSIWTSHSSEKGKVLKFKQLNDTALPNKSSESYRVSLAIWDHTVLPATRHKWTHPALASARQAGTQFTYVEGMEGWVDIQGLYEHIPSCLPVSQCMLVVVQAPFVPFLTEHMYQNLRHLIDAESTKGTDTSSVHYLMLPQPK